MKHFFIRHPRMAVVGAKAANHGGHCCWDNPALCAALGPATRMRAHESVERATATELALDSYLGPMV